MTKAARRFLPLLKKFPSPGDYFRGVAPDEFRLPFNLLFFSRLRPEDLGQRNAIPSLHRRSVLIFNLQGAGALILDGRCQELRSGDCALILPHQIHAFSDLQEKAICWLFLTFDLANPETLEPLRNRSLPIPGICLEWLAQLLADWKHHPHRSPFLTGLILHELGRVAEKSGSPLRSRPRAREQFVTRLHAHLEAQPGLRIKELARRMGFSEPHLRAEFRARTRLSLGFYLRQFRLNRAALLLASTSLSVGEIAVQCGFESLYSFSRSFRLAVGQPPRDYRREFLNASAR